LKYMVSNKINYFRIYVVFYILLDIILILTFIKCLYIGEIVCTRDLKEIDHI